MIIGIDASKAANENKTGVDNVVYQLILNLKKIDKKNNYFLYTNKKLSPELLSDKFIEKLIPFPKFWNKFRLPLALIKDKPDKFLELSYALPPHAPEKSVLLVHDLAFKFFPEAYSKYELMLLESAIEAGVKRAKKIILTGEQNKKDFLKFYKISNEKLSVVKLGYNIESNILVSDARNKLSISQPYFLFVGRIEKRKNVLNIVKAFETYKASSKKETKLVLAGSDGFGAAEIKKYINLSEYSKDIILPGYIKKEELSPLYSKSLAVVYPSLYEGFGFPILEAFAFGVPVLTSDIPVLHETGGDGALYANPKNPEDIAKKLLEISTDEKLRKELILNGKKQLKLFSWENTAKQVHEILEGL
jgi:glycosyltransferase involved in cell wall biosynthesis